jgi:hypothetical protein
VKRSITRRTAAALIKCRLAQSGVHAQRGYRSLRYELVVRCQVSEKSLNPDHPLQADHSDFDGGAVRHARQDGRQPLLDKVNVLERCVYLIEHMPQRKRNRMKIRKKASHIFRRERREKTVLTSITIG